MFDPEIHENSELQLESAGNLGEQAQNEQPATEESVQPVQAKESPADRNFRALRQKAERIERERDEALRKLQEVEAARQPNPAATQEDVEINIGDDDLAEGKHLRKVSTKMKRLEEELKQYKQQASLSAIEIKLKSQYPDFDKVVSKDNIEALKDSYPELAATLSASSDVYATAVSAYTMIKKFGIAQEEAPYDAEKILAQRNAAKPRPLASVSPQQGDTPLSRANAFANGLTDELKAQLRKEMEDARKAH